MNPSFVMKNHRTCKTCKIERESVREDNVIYSTKCGRCGLLFVVQTRDQLNIRFIGHIKCHDGSSKLQEHFDRQGYKFDKG